MNLTQRIKLATEQAKIEHLTKLISTYITFKKPEQYKELLKELKEINNE